MSSINITVSDFNSAWHLLVNEILKNGERSLIGDPDNPHQVKGSSGMITLKNNAIKQIEYCEVHPDYPLKFIQQYCDQFTYEWKKENGVGGFTYTYFDRLTDYDSLDQLDKLGWGLEDQILNDMSSNRNHAITWVPVFDSGNKSPPCLQSINVRYIGNHEVDIFIYWRSRDAYTAWQANIIAITYMLNKYVIKPNDCTIRSYTEFCNHYHIYESDQDVALKVRPLNTQISYE